MKENRQRPLLAIVLPCYNEEAIILQTVRTLTHLLDGYKEAGLIAAESFLLFVDDGSRDNTLALLRGAAGRTIRVLRLARNVGHQHALLAGMHHVTGKVDAMISMDADLQDDTSSIKEMIVKYSEGAHIVYGIRSSRESDTAYKRGTALLFYRLMKRMGISLIYNHADYRLLSNTALQEFGKYREVNLFLRGIFPKMGFTSAEVYYDRQTRQAGDSKYPFRKMLSLAVNGITSFSNVPLKLIAWTGFSIFVVTVILSLWVLWVVLRGDAVPGWASITLPIYFLGGIQLLALGILGEYVSKIYMETKQRPRYHIEEEIGG